MDIAGLDPATLADSVKPLLDWRDVPVDLASLAALAAGLGWASGLRLYALVFVLGALARFAGVHLPGGLGVLAHPLVLGVSGLLPLDDLRGQPDADGRIMRSTVRAVADELDQA